ncbi:MAG: hypothetical protein KDD39_16090, partial [Bdellovibrionales bacterium]|nr:hypothetical protein [Bdellovibrionales bacterium]
PELEDTFFQLWELNVRSYRFHLREATTRRWIVQVAEIAKACSLFDRSFRLRDGCLQPEAHPFDWDSNSMFS